ncbi:MAG: glycosyltransferase [Lachnospiraceae bacterium]|nr:glycosyltransferase [Lachnospiraceae bacterium]
MKKNIFCKISNDRALEFQITTKIQEDEDGKKFVYKYANFDEGEAHIRKIAENYDRLSEKYAGTEIVFAKACAYEKGIRIEYIEGESFDSVLAELLNTGETEKFAELVDKYFESLFVDSTEFIPTEQFEKVFGNGQYFEGQPAVRNIDIDGLFANVIYSNGKWIFYDYEWVFDFLVPIEFVKYRIIFLYFMQFISKCDKSIDFYRRFGIDREKNSIYENMEDRFQMYVSGETKSLWKLYADSDICGRVIPAIKAIMQEDKLNVRKVFQVFYNRGDGYNEENSALIACDEVEDKVMQVEIPVYEDTLSLRIDPAAGLALIRVDVLIDDSGKPLSYTHNGIELKNSILFLDCDPQLYISLANTEIKNITMRYALDVLLSEKEFTETEISDVGRYINCKLNELVALKTEKDNLLLCIKDKDRELQDKDRELQDKDRELQDRDKQITDMLSSRSWRITKPLRKLTNLMRKSKVLRYGWSALHPARGESDSQVSEVTNVDIVEGTDNQVDDCGRFSMWTAEKLAEAKEKIRAAEVVSFDVFDTLIVRITNEPEDVFELLEKKVGIRDFAAARKQLQFEASQLAEKNQNKPHANFDEIYQYIAEQEHGDTNWEAVKQVEVEIEKNVIRCNYDIKPLYEYAKNLGKRIIVTSDMYFNAEQIKSFVEDCGYKDIAQYYVSADVGKTKYQGDIFAYITTQEHVPADKILHIGDNRESDVKLAAKSGWSTFEYKPVKVPGENQVKDKFVFQDGIASFLLNDRKSFWYNLGVYVGGPLYSGFQQWFSQQIIKDDYDKLFFLARDGYNMHHLCTKQGMEKIQYIYTSRRALLLAGITELDEQTLELLPPYTFGQTVRDVLAYLDMDGLYDDYIQDSEFESLDSIIANEVDIVKMRNMYALNEEGFLKKCSEERENAKKYFASIGFLDVNALVFDCGWNGSSQYLLNRFLKTIDYKGKNHFIYVGIMNSQKSKTQLLDLSYEAYLFNQNTNEDIQQKIKHCIIILELFFSAPEESLLRYSSEGLIMEQLGTDNMYKKDLLEGIVAYTQHCTKLLERYSVQITVEQALGNYLRLIENPLAMEAVTIGNLENTDGFVALRNQKKYIARLDYDTFVKNKVNEIYWPKGLLTRPDLDTRLRPYMEEYMGNCASKNNVQKTEIVPQNTRRLKLFRRPFFVNWRDKGFYTAWYIRQNIRKQSKLNVYHRWINEVEKSIWDTSELQYKPMFSVVIPVYNVVDEQLISCIESVLRQTYKNFELILVDDCSSWESVRKVLKKYENKPKVKIIYRQENGHIAEATNSGLQIAEGDFIAFVDCDDVISKHALYEIAVKLNENPELDFIYSDDDKLTEDGKERKMPFFKPDWSPDTFWSLMYTNHLGVYRRSLVNQIGGLRSEYNGAQDYDFTLRFMEVSDNSRVGHVAKILYHWRERENSIALKPEAKQYALDAVRKLKEDALKRRDLRGTVEYVEGLYQYRIIYDVPDDAYVSVIIPSKDNITLLKRCIKSIKRTEGVCKYEIIIVDNGSTEKNRQAVVRFAKEYNIKYIYMPMEFNFSKMCNMGAEAAEGNYLLFLNDDIEAAHKGWVDIMVGHAAQAHTGAVGAKLLYPKSDKIQHIGVTNLPIGPSHSLIGHSDDMVHYFFRNRMEYNWLAVTAACLMVSKRKFEEIEGFDEKLKVAYNDVDLCFKLYEKGYYNVVRNDVQLYHYESVSRGNDQLDSNKVKRLHNELVYLYDKHKSLYGKDPFYNKNLISDGVNYEIALHKKYSGELHEYNKYDKYVRKFLIYVDRIDYGTNIAIKGWYYTGKPKRDNSRKVCVMLKSEDGSCISLKADKVMRPDVGEALENHACLVGFEAYIPESILDLKEKRYEIGLRISGDFPKRWFVCWTDKFVAQ